jgi:hypothetical protein
MMQPFLRSTLAFFQRVTRACLRVTRFAGRALRDAADAVIPAAGAWLLGGGPERLVRRLALTPWTRVPLAAAFLAALCVAALVGGTRRIAPGEIGVRQVNFGTGTGIVEQDYPSGSYFALPGRSTWHVLDGRTRFLRFAWKTEGGRREAIEARTQDGNTVQLGVSVPFEIRPGEAHRIVADGIKGTYELQVEAVVEAVVLQEASQWSSEQLYSTNARQEFGRRALEALNPKLADLHVTAEGVFLSGVWFPPVFEKKLQERQIEGQAALTKAAQNLLADAVFEQERTEAEIVRAESLLERDVATNRDDLRRASAAEVASIDREASQRVARRRAEAEAQALRLDAESALLLAQAEALEEKLRAEIFESAGGRYLLARQAAANLNFEKVTLDSRDPRLPSVLDLDGLVKLLVGTRP